MKIKMIIQASLFFLPQLIEWNICHHIFKIFQKIYSYFVVIIENTTHDALESKFEIKLKKKLY